MYKLKKKQQKTQIVVLGKATKLTLGIRGEGIEYRAYRIRSGKTTDSVS